MQESDITNPLLKAASKLGARLFRQNVGTGWVGRVLRHDAQGILLGHPRVLHAGLCKGSSDVIGWMPVTITPDMVGRQVALFVALEIKTPGVPTTKEQSAFVEAVRSAGGYAAVVRNVEDGIAALGPRLV